MAGLSHPTLPAKIAYRGAITKHKHIESIL
uniref:Uncharacterized protein n=1 Tax=Anguilla anguilla TaxID=7936 RepID=A0A0E9T408_ANGAN